MLSGRINQGVAVLLLILVIVLSPIIIFRVRSITGTIQVRQSSLRPAFYLYIIGCWMDGYISMPIYIGVLWSAEPQVQGVETRETEVGPIVEANAPSPSDQTTASEETSAC